MLNQQRRDNESVLCRNSEIVFISKSRKQGRVVIGRKSAALEDEAAEGSHMQKLKWVTKELQGQQLSEKQAGNITQQQSGCLVYTKQQTHSTIPQSAEQKESHCTLQHR